MNNSGKYFYERVSVASPKGHGEGEGEGGDEVFTVEQVSERIEQALSEARQGFESETQGLAKKNRELLDTLSNATEKLKKTDGIDIESLLQLQKTIENDEILKLAAAGDHTGAIEKATEKMRVTHDANMEEMSTALLNSQESSVKDKVLIDKLLIDGGSQRVFLESKGLPEAAADVALRARQIWKVEEGELIARDGDGEMIKGEKGPITMAEWTASLKNSAPHLFPASESAKIRRTKTGEADLNDIDEQMVIAAKSGDTATLRLLKAEKKKGQVSR
jgi:hypothetical protein|tara:strand:+ start:774 stop:1601 length:828 start_codon:yes stop_codon:yes gene_type:complete